MSTPHNATASGDIAKTVPMPGGPLRAKFATETYLENPVQFNTVRSMFGRTGTYKGKKISVTGSGMRMINIRIYPYELYKFYEVESIIQIGGTGAYTGTLKLFDLVLAGSAWSEPTSAEVQADVDGDIRTPGVELNAKIEAAAARVNKPLTEARIHSSDIFYHEDNVDGHREFFEKHGCVCAEMESFALFHNVKILDERVACLLTISDSLVTHAETTAQKCQTSFHDIMLVALETAVAL